MRKRVLGACLAPLVLLALAGCSKPADGDGVASANSAAAPSATPNMSVLEQGRRHAQCMRDHGVPESDPQVQPNGGVRLGGGYDKHTLDQDVLAKAIEGCKQYEPVLSPEDRSKKLDGAQQLARCMREHGVESYPDPDPGDIGRSVPDSIRDDPQFDSAKQACQGSQASAASTEKG